jgi:calcineurin-like phosphoesterase family protein
MKTWITTDTHFYHDNMVKLCGRPQDFHEIIVCNWKSMVSDDDLVIHLGDVSFAKDTVVSALPGRKVLVKGNHDKQSYSWYMQHGFDFCCESFVMYTGGLDIVFTHKPLVFHDHDVNIHGHLHGLARVDSVCRHYPVALECTDYKPLLLSDILPKLRNGGKQ